MNNVVQVSSKTHDEVMNMVNKLANDPLTRFDFVEALGEVQEDIKCMRNGC